VANGVSFYGGDRPRRDNLLPRAVDVAPLPVLAPLRI